MKTIYTIDGPYHARTPAGWLRHLLHWLHTSFMRHGRVLR